MPALRRSSQKILTAMGYYGLAEVEFMRDPRDGVFKLLEINPRSWKWHTLAIKAGVDLPFMVYLDLIGREPAPSVRGCLNVKWIELISDFYIAVGEMMKGKLSWPEYLDSFKGKCEFAIASRDDPKPFLSYLLMLPYLFFTR
jgi:predicted ATP-grasp superfamily ATP-dependent carboligase